MGWLHYLVSNFHTNFTLVSLPLLSGDKLIYTAELRLMDLWKISDDVSGLEWLAAICIHAMCVFCVIVVHLELPRHVIWPGTCRYNTQPFCIPSIAYSTISHCFVRTHDPAIFMKYLHKMAENHRRCFFYFIRLESRKVWIIVPGPAIGYWL